MRFIKKCLAFCICLSMTFILSVTAYANDVNVNSQFNISGPDIDSDAAIAMDSATGAILYSKNADSKMYPASITKLMTVLLCLENCKLDEIVTFSYDAVFSIEQGSSHIGIREGEKLTVEQCLYGILLASANEVSYAIGEHVAKGDINKFVDMMNERAKSLGCLNTHFCNPHGLHDPDHYTCPYDMALIAQELLKNDTFRTISSTGFYEIPPTNKVDETRYLANTHQMLIDSEYNYEGVEGGKTGFTDDALNTLVTYAAKDNFEVITVTMHGNGTHYKDTISILDFVYDNFRAMNVAENETKFSQKGSKYYTPVENIFEYNKNIITIDKNAFILLPINKSFSDAESVLVMDEDTPYLSYSLAGVNIGKADLKLSNSEDLTFAFVDKTNSKSNNLSKYYTIRFLILAVVLLALLFGLYYFFKYSRYMRRRRNRFKLHF